MKRAPIYSNYSQFSVVILTHWRERLIDQQYVVRKMQENKIMYKIKEKRNKMRDQDQKF